MPMDPDSRREIENIIGRNGEQIAEIIINANEELNSRIQTTLAEIENQVESVYSELSTAIRAMNNELTEFIEAQRCANRLNQAETRVVRIRQEIDKKYGHYDIVRRTTQGILQADDLELIKKSTVHNITEELFITTPNYWLAPCLVALAAWINDNPELAQKAVKEAVHRDDEKTSLFFAILCRRANRMSASLKWVRRYLAQQDEAHLNRHAIIILDGLVCGLWGVDSENVISAQFDEWLQRLEAKPNFTENQITEWKKVIASWVDPLGDTSFKTLTQYSPTWNLISDSLRKVKTHQKMLAHFQKIYNRKETVGDTIQVLDECLNNLVTNFDDEEIPLRKEEMLEQLIIQYKGDEKIAKSKLAVEEKVFDEKNYMQLLLEAAFNPDTSHASSATCKFALAVCKSYIYDAHSDFTAQYRSKIPKEVYLYLPAEQLRPDGMDISYTFPEFRSSTQDGSNEENIIHSLTELAKDTIKKVVDSTMNTLKQARLTRIVICSLVCLVCLYIAFTLSSSALIIAILSGAAIPLIIYSNKKKMASVSSVITASFENVIQRRSETIRTFCAEVVDYRTKFAADDAYASKVSEFLDGLVANEYIHINTDRRRIRNHG